MNFHAKRFIGGGKRILPSKNAEPGNLLQDNSTLLPGSADKNYLNNFFCADEGGATEIMLTGSNGYSNINVPDFRRLINDCGKMTILHKLLQRLYNEKHRCLIFCQMTKMMDIIEEYLSWMQFQYFRMDGSTQINDRRDMVDEYQRNDNIFIFLLSTRAGGLGVTLTGADTVIFYDNDWNPTMDAQATDRAHRIGQTKPVSVYRLITRHTVEENILKRAKQKENVQSTVYAGGALRADTLKQSELVGFLVDEEEEKPQPGSFIKPKRKGKNIKQEESKEKGVEPTQALDPEGNKIHYHYMKKGDRTLKINDEDEEKAKEALKHFKEHKDEEKVDEDLGDEIKDLLKNVEDEEVKIEDEDIDKIQIEEE